MTMRTRCEVDRRVLEPRREPFLDAADLALAGQEGEDGAALRTQRREDRGGHLVRDAR
jgi:hypothetical protein